MRTPDQFRAKPCPKCGTPQKVLNGLWLRTRRERAGIGLREFARRLEISAPYLSDIERNYRACPEVISRAYDGL